MKRRNFLKIIGGGVVLAAGGVGANAMRSPSDALAPWQVAGTPTDPRLKALSHAILAPNPHNMQPWQIALEGDDAIRLHIDPDRLLPHTDPFNRQITIGQGCFLELLRMALAEQGIGCEITPFPEGADPNALDSRPVAQVTLVGSATPDPLFQHHISRRSLKEPFDTARPVDQATLARITAAGGAGTGGSIAPDEIAYWRDLTHDALRIEIDTPRTYQESVDVFRIGAAEVNA
ncbi:MAG: Acg family FMN-binding oxidoreductase, partial [Shimia sp.]